MPKKAKKTAKPKAAAAPEAAVKRKKGQQPYVPTDDARAQVRALSGFGLPQTEIAKYLKITRPTLAKYYPDELERARPDLMAMAGGGLFNALHKKETWAIKYVHGTLGRRFGWTERHELSIDFGQALGGADFSRLTSGQFQQLLDLLEIAGVHIPAPVANAARPLPPQLIGSGTGASSHP